MRKRWIASALSCFLAVSTILSGCGSSTGTSVQSEVAQEKNEEEFQENIEALIKRVDVPVKAALGKTNISVNDFVNLQIGDIIRLDTDVDQDLTVYVGNIKKFTALPGSSKDKYAVRVTSVIREGE